MATPVTRHPSLNVQMEEIEDKLSELLQAHDTWICRGIDAANCRTLYDHKLTHKAEEAYDDKRDEFLTFLRGILS